MKDLGDGGTRVLWGSVDWWMQLVGVCVSNPGQLRPNPNPGLGGDLSLSDKPNPKHTHPRPAWCYIRLLRSMPEVKIPLVFSG